MLIPFVLTLLAPAHAEPTWQETLDQVVPGVVALRVNATRDFDTESTSASVGTGFVVDAERGLILTNRHMVHAGPVVAEAVFLNHEEVDLQAIYRDPVHDFGVYRFDPEEVQYMDLVELELAPHLATVGMEIRVIGNDSGEKISILDGTLARLDRNAPDYGQNTYNDFNTFYLQAASNTSGGSSGSPVVGIDGMVVALNAGGKRSAASSFYLPLHRVVRALDLIRLGQPVPRGTLQTEFRYTPYDEVRRLGLQEITEAAMREAFPEGTGMLVVAKVVPSGPAHGKLEPGDVLVKVDDQLVTEFVPLESRLDDNVGKPVTLTIERGGEEVQVELTVGDLHAITPAAYLEMGRGIFNELSYQQARHHSVPVHGVYVARPGYALGRGGIPAMAIIESLDGEAIDSLGKLKEVLETKAHGQRVRFRYHPLAEPEQAREAVVRMDRQWNPMRLCTRDDTTGRWPCVDSPAPPDPQPLEPATVSFPTAQTKAGAALANSLVVVDFDVPYASAGIKDFNYMGTGVVVDAAKGLVLVDRDTVPVGLGDIELTFGGAVRVPGRMYYLHPTHNFAVLKYDPGLLGDTPVKSAVLLDKRVEPGDTVFLVGLNSSHQLVELETTVNRDRPIAMGLAGTPRFRDSNVEGLELADSMPSIGGVLADKKGRVLAHWASFLDQADENRTFYGLPVAFIEPVLGPLRRGETATYRSLGAELWPISLADAKDRGLPEGRLQALIAHDPERRRVLEVRRLVGGSPAQKVLQNGDLILQANGAPITRMLEVEELQRADSVRLLLFRDGAEVEVDIPTVELDGMGPDRMVQWAGLIIHEAHYEVAAQTGRVDEGVYVTWLWYGSPGSRYKLRPTRRIEEVNGTPTPDLDAFLAAVEGMEDRQPVRVKMRTVDGEVLVRTLKLDLQYWPTQVLDRQDDGTWTLTHP